MPIAFKEWAVTVRALAEGEQLITLRKGGIREENAISRSSTTASSSTPPSTTSAGTSCVSRTSPSCAARSRRASGPTASRPPTRSAATAGSRSPTACASAPGPRSPATTLITDPRCVDALSPYYVWTRDYAEKRLAWKRRHPLHVILLRTYRIPRPVTVKVRDEYGGCRSWLELHRELPVRGHARCSPTTSSSARPRRSRRSPRTPCPSWPSGARIIRSEDAGSASGTTTGREIVHSVQARVEASAVQNQPVAWCTQIAGDSSAACAARELLTDRLGDVTPADTMHDLHLLATELITNAVLHAAADVIELRVAFTDDGMRVSVTDPGAETVPVVQELDPAVPGGMGLFLVEQISTGWGVERTPGGENRVWFDLAA